MSSSNKSCFTSYIHLSQVSRMNALNRLLKKEIGAIEDIDDFGKKWSRKNYQNGYSSYSSFDQLHETSPNFAELKKKIQPHMQSFARALKWDLRGGRLRMTTCWVNRMDSGCHHTMHIHPGSVVSGVYYVDVPRGSSPLKIEDPRLGFMMSAPPRARSAAMFQQPFVELTAKTSQLVLFESWMRHEVPPHRARKPRFSVSFNFEWVN